MPYFFTGNPDYLTSLPTTPLPPLPSSVDDDVHYTPSTTNYELPPDVIIHPTDHVITSTSPSPRTLPPTPLRVMRPDDVTTLSPVVTSRSTIPPTTPTTTTTTTTPRAITTTTTMIVVVDGDDAIDEHPDVDVAPASPSVGSGDAADSRFTDRELRFLMSKGLTRQTIDRMDTAYVKSLIQSYYRMRRPPALPVLKVSDVITTLTQ